MFKSIKEFFVGKPKVEEPKVEEPTIIITDTAVQDMVITGAAGQPVIEEIKPETVTISISDNMNVSVGTQSDTITFTSIDSQPDTITLAPADPGAWPFPNTQPAETEVKKKRTFVKREETATEKKPTPAIKATKSKPRKKK